MGNVLSEIHLPFDFKHEKNLQYRYPHGPSALVVIGGRDDINDSRRSRKEEERIASKELSAAARGQQEEGASMHHRSNRVQREICGGRYL